MNVEYGTYEVKILNYLDNPSAYFYMGTGYYLIDEGFGYYIDNCLGRIM